MAAERDEGARTVVAFGTVWGAQTSL